MNLEYHSLACLCLPASLPLPLPMYPRPSAPTYVPPSLCPYLCTPAPLPLPMYPRPSAPTYVPPPSRPKQALAPEHRRPHAAPRAPLLPPLQPPLLPWLPTSLHQAAAPVCVRASTACHSACWPLARHPPGQQ